MTPEKKQDTVINVFYYGIIALGVFVGIRLTFRYLLPALYPFAIAFFVSALLNPLMMFLEKRAGVPRRLGGFLLVTLTVAGVFALMFFIIRQGAEEIGRLADRLSTLTPEDFVPLKERVNRLLLHLPGLDTPEDLNRFWQGAEERTAAVLSESIPGLKSGIGMLTGVFTGLFDVVLTFFVTVVACYYMTVDRAKISAAVHSVLPEKAGSALKRLKGALFSTVGKYLKAYGLIVLITFTELFAAFTVLRVDYALLLAAVIALIDILPVLGTGLVLIPWALICLFIQGNTFLGTGLIISYVLITVIRQIIEPKIVGSYIGIHPLATLAAMFAGLKLFGFMGMLLLPVGLMGIKNVTARRTEGNSK